MKKISFLVVVGMLSLVLGVNGQIGNAMASILNPSPPNTGQQYKSNSSIGDILAKVIGDSSNTNVQTQNQNQQYPLSNPTLGNALQANILAQTQDQNQQYPLSNPTLGIALQTSIKNSTTSDNAFISFLLQSSVPNATVLPTLQQCRQYTIKANGTLYKPSSNNYNVSCSLPYGKNYSQLCYGSASCDYLTCKFLKCSRVPGGNVYRIKL